MKMTKKILLAAVATAAVIFTGCMKEVGTKDLFSYSDANYEDANGTATVDYTNDGDDFVRGMKLLKTKHYGTTAIITLNDPSVDVGVLGLTFGVNENTAKSTYDFMNVGARYHSSQVQSYISAYYNISGDNFSADNFGAPKNSGISAKDSSKEDSYEIDVSKIQKSNSFMNMNDYAKVADGKKTLVVKIQAESDGSYSIIYYKPVVVNSNYSLNAEEMAKTENQLKVTVASTVSGYNAKTQTKIGFYANVYPHQTLNGSIKLLDTEGNPIPLEWDEESEACPLF